MAVSSVAVLVCELRAPLKWHRLPLVLQATSELQAAYWCVVAAVLNSVDAFRAAADDETALQVRLVIAFIKSVYQKTTFTHEVMRMAVDCRRDRGFGSEGTQEAVAVVPSNQILPPICTDLAPI